MPADTPEKRLPIVLTFSASDPTGGAGMQADLLTLAALGCHPLSVMTALTVQDTAGVDAVLPLDDEWIIDQARTLLEDMPVAAFKLGMLGSIENVAAIASIVADYPDIPLIFDPVLASGRGDTLADEDMISAMVQLLLPQTTLLTPNSLEARRLVQVMAEDDEDKYDEETDPPSPAPPAGLAFYARHLTETGCENVLVTGTHENTDKVINTLYGRQGVIRSDRWERLPGSYHGSGCTLASAIAANLAHGMDIIDAVQAGQKYTWHTLAAGFRPGMGQYLPDRFFWAHGHESEDDTGN